MDRRIQAGDKTVPKITSGTITSDKIYWLPNNAKLEFSIGKDFASGGFIAGPTVCSICYATVESANKGKHAKWHEALNTLLEEV